MLTEIVDLTECLTSALMSNMQSLCQIYINYIDLKLTHTEIKGKTLQLIVSGD